MEWLVGIAVTVECLWLKLPRSTWKNARRYARNHLRRGGHWDQAIDSGLRVARIEADRGYVLVGRDL